MLSLIERFYLKVCSDADCPSLIEHMEKTYAELCRRNVVPLDMQVGLKKNNLEKKN